MLASPAVESMADQFIITLELFLQPFGATNETECGVLVSMLTTWASVVVEPRALTAWIRKSYIPSERVGRDWVPEPAAVAKVVHEFGQAGLDCNLYWYLTAVRLDVAFADQTKSMDWVFANQ